MTVCPTNFSVLHAGLAFGLNHASLQKDVVRLS